MITWRQNEESLSMVFFGMTGKFMLHSIDNSLYDNKLVNDEAYIGLLRRIPTKRNRRP